MTRREDRATSIDDWEVLDLLTTLVDKSLAVYDEASGRFRMMETIGEYARERLEAAGESALLSERHAAHFAELVEQAEQGLQGSEYPKWRSIMAAEIDNIRSVLARAHGVEGAVEIFSRMAGGIWRFFEGTAHMREGKEQFERLLASAGASDDPRLAEIRIAAARLSFYLWILEDADTHFAEALRIYDSCGDTLGRANAKLGLGLVASVRQDHDTALRMGEGALKAFEELGDTRGQARALNALGVSFMAAGDYDGARSILERSLEMRRELGDREGETIVLDYLGACHYEAGNDQEAYEHYLEAYHRSLDVDNQHGIPLSLASLGYLTAAADPQASLRNLKEALVRLRSLADEKSIGYCLRGVALAAQSMGMNEEALYFALHGKQVADRLGVSLSRRQAQAMEALIAKEQAILGQRHRAVAEEVAAESIDDAILRAIALVERVVEN